MKTTRKTGVAVGDILMHDHREMVCYWTTDTSAKLTPLGSKLEHRTREEDGKIQFHVIKGDVVSISPNSEINLVEALGRKGFAEYLDKRSEETKESKSMDKKEKKTKKNKEDSERSPGKLGGYNGHSMTSVFRAFGKAGWTLDEAREFCKREKIAAADNTIKIQLRRGAKGEEDPAPISKDELARIKPKVEKKEKAEKSDKKSKKKDKKNGKNGKKNGEKKHKDKDKETPAEGASEDAGEEGEAGEE
jgi:hypothetical protein